MSVIGGPDIITDGLVLHLDAADKKSYPGSGTTWYDRSGNGNNGTLVNSPTFDGGNGGSIVFDGAYSYVIGDSNLGVYGDPNFTICYWAYWNLDNWISNYPSGFGNNTTGITNQGLSTTWRDGRIALDYWNYRFRSSSALLVKKWYYVSFVKVSGLSNSTNTKLYSNGEILQGSVEGSGVSPNIIDSKFIVGRLDSSRVFNGYINGIGVYNRALSASEIQQNFNATKGRFNL